MTATALQPLTIHSIKTGRLFYNIDLALGLVPYSVAVESHSDAADVSPQEHFRVARRVLVHLLGDDIGFSNGNPALPDTAQEYKLWLLYQSDKAWKLYADAVGTPLSEITPWLMHRFFARIAWLDESVISSEAARAQLQDFVYGLRPYRDTGVVVDLEDYPLLGELVEPVPEDLRHWMVQFKRGGQLMPLGEWIARSTGHALYNGIFAQRHEATRPSLDVFSDAVAAMVPAGEYRDKALSGALAKAIGSLATWLTIVYDLKAIPEGDRPDSRLQLDVLTPTSIDSRAGFLRKVAVYVLNPADEDWLTVAIANARMAPGLQILSLASALRFRHAQLRFEPAMAMATLLLLPGLQLGREAGEALSTVRALSVTVPRLDSWSTLRSANELFRQAGIGLLFKAEGAPNVLRWRASQTWHMLMQTRQFTVLFAPMLVQMQWYTGGLQQHASPQVTQALAGRAIVDYFLGATSTFAEPLAATLRGAWLADYSHAQLCTRVRAAIEARQPDASSSTLDMLFYLLLRETLPELLVEDVPDHLQYARSLQSVALMHGVAMVEGLRQGQPLVSRFDDLVGVSAGLTQSSDPGVHALWARTLIVPALRYATAHGAIEWSGAVDIERASAAQINQALTLLTAQQTLHAAELNTLLALRPPDRKHLAQQMLTEAGMDRRTWDLAIKVEHWPILQEHGFTLSATYSLDRLLAVGRPQATIVELVMMGEAYLGAQPTVPQAWARAFEAYRQAMVQAQAPIISRLLSEMSATDRTVLLGSTCEVSRVLFDKEQGAQGLFIRCQPGDHRADFHDHTVAGEVFLEIIPASGVVRRITQRFEYNVELEPDLSDNPVVALDTEKRNAKKKADALITPLLPFDSDGYLKGAASRVSAVYPTPLKGTLAPCTELIYTSQGSDQSRFDAFAQVAAGHQLASLLEQSRVLHSHDTAWEALWAKERRFADMAARLVIPFYGCISDLVAGKHSAGVIVGCVVDAAFALIPFGQFAGSTARIVLRAGELSVLSVIESTGKAVGRLIVGLAEQSALFVVRDVGKWVLKLGRLGWTKLLEEVPALKKLFSSADLFQDAASQVRRALVDGRPNVAVHNVGTPEAPDFRLFDTQAGSAFGKRLSPVSAGDPLEFSILSTLERIGPDHYPAIVPVTSGAEGWREINIAEGCSVRAIEREEGVFTVLIDAEVYHLDTTAANAAMRKLVVNNLSSDADWLSEVENLCRPRRNLEPVPCATGVKLATPKPEPVSAGSTSPTRTGKYPSHAMDAREFSLARLSAGAGDVSQDVDVFVYEGKFSKWAEPSEATASTSTQVPVAKTVVALSEQERALFALPESPAYLPVLKGKLASDGVFGLPENFTGFDTLSIYENAPVIELGPVAAGINDARTLRGIRMKQTDVDWIFVEPDTGIFYKALTPKTLTVDLNFSRVNEVAEINEFIRLSEQYRLVRERPGVLTDQENIARLLFDLLDESEREAWRVSWGKEVITYDDYVAMCIAKGEANELMTFASNILAGEDIQKNFVELARQSLPDFKKIAERTVPEQQHIVEVLNGLMPVQGSKYPWTALSLADIAQPKAYKSILKQIKGANLSFVQVYTEAGERVVYYALSGGEKAKDLKLSLDTAETTEHVIDGVIFRDARARMAGRLPDPSFTSLPVVRDASRLVVRDFGRQLDSERLIATVLKQDMAATKLSHIKFFTVLDTCRSCGGFVLPRLKLDFAQAQFSVTYLKDYTLS
ncbi:deaminase domain-containing protein [Pseudomonas sp. 3A(2025)]